MYCVKYGVNGSQEPFHQNQHKSLLDSDILRRKFDVLYEVRSKNKSRTILSDPTHVSARLRHPEKKISVFVGRYSFDENLS